ncbi:MAG: nopaline dehydrogenase, partial [Gammaproteobacteria bacterium]
MNRQFTHDYDSLVIGGGLVGAALAAGIAGSGRRVAVFDGGDRDFRASRGNFGLVWVQGKGADY